ncbi:MAG: type II toxin-antitoxin system CcdA family antitoxin [Candidatus Bathyarchaeota archaeon]|nr:MAG: type II toxin-antitoxin system CcdA family antitoxin [Candidatus Bathyarchaeota archaeon]
MEKIKVTITLDKKLVQRLEEVGFDISAYAERAIKQQFERMQGKPIT